MSSKMHGHGDLFLEVSSSLLPKELQQEWPAPLPRPAGSFAPAWDLPEGFLLFCEGSSTLIMLLSFYSWETSLLPSPHSFEDVEIHRLQGCFSKLAVGGSPWISMWPMSKVLPYSRCRVLLLVLKWTQATWPENQHHHSVSHALGTALSLPSHDPFLLGSAPLAQKRRAEYGGGSFNSTELLSGRTRSGTPTLGLQTTVLPSRKRQRVLW